MKSSREAFAGGGHSDEVTVKEMQKWKLVTFAAIPLCIGMAVYDLSGEAAHAVTNLFTRSEDVCHSWTKEARSAFPARFAHLPERVL